MIPQIQKAKRSPRYVLSLAFRKAGFLRAKLPPLSVHLFPSLTCGSRCFFCWLWGEHGYAFSRKSRAYPLSFFLKIIEQLPFLTGEIVYLGGEPTLHREVWQLIAKAKQKGLRTVLVSSGGGNVPEQVASCLDAVVVSLDGTEAKHDAVRGEGSFARAVAFLKALDAARKRKQSLFPELYVSFTIHSRNQDNLFLFLQEIEKIALPLQGVTFHHLEFVGKTEVDGLAASYPVPSPSPSFWKSFQMEPHINTEQLLAQLGEVKRKQWHFPIAFSPDFSAEELRSYYQKTIPFRGCAFIEAKVQIYPQGEVWLCPGLSLGNVGEARLGEIWQSEKARRVRKWIREGHTFSVCARCPGNRL